ncbi:MAG: MlaD family protein [Gammaproteobacteria bacterium]
MSKKANPAVIGSFVVGAIVLIIGSIFLFGGGKFFKDVDSYVAYFDGSMKGLDVGAPVTFRGVRIGSVTDILSVYDFGEDAIYFPVIMEIEGDHFINVGDADKIFIDESDDEAVMAHLYDQGMRAKLEMRSFVTGQLNVDIDMYPGTEINLRDHSYPGDQMEFPTIPSDVQRILRSVQNFANKLEDLPVDETIKEIRGVIKGLDDLVNSPELEGAVGGFDKLVNSPELEASIVSLHSALDSFDSAMSSTQRVMDRVDGEIGPTVAELRKSATRIGEVLEQTQGLLNELQKGLGEDSELRVHTTTAMGELSKAARSLRVLSDYLQTHPEALIRGKQ